MPDELDPSTDGTHRRHRHRDVLVVLVRHGQSIWNAEGRYQGQRGPGLTELGHEQAASAARYLHDEFDGFHHAIASDLPRVQETRAPWTDLTGITPVIDERWREIDAGDWSGRFPDEVGELFPDELARFRRGEDISRGGGETFAELRTRTWSAMTAAAATPVDGVAPGDETRIVIFTHGGCINMAAAQTLRLPPMGHTWLRSPANCSISVFRHAVDAAGEVNSSSLEDYNVDTTDSRQVATPR